MDTILTLAIPVTFLLMLGLERAFPRQRLPTVRHWALKGFVFFVISAAMNAAVPAGIAALLAGKTLVSLAGLGTVTGALVAIVIGDAFAYAVHRTMHNVHWLWRWTHQMHHSAERLDLFGASYFHPFDFVLQIGASALAVMLLGVTPDAAALAGFVGFLLAMFQHMNVRTPRWLGYLVQRPEQHNIHHARGVHAYNYGSVMFLDMILGTFRNPAAFEEPCGFWDGASAEMGRMLLGRDVAEPPATASRPAPIGDAAAAE